jgi:aminoglycoside phosphotransferase family enzyme/predicted kinase
MLLISQLRAPGRATGTLGAQRQTLGNADVSTPVPIDPTGKDVASVPGGLLIKALLRPEAHEPPEPAVQLLETHISWILLAGERAYKIKKPVNLGFVDFSTPELRARCCAEELRLNRRLAPDLYLAVVPVHGPPAEARFHGDGPVIEMALMMRRFPQSALLPAALARAAVPAEAFIALAARLAAFHARAAVAGPADPWGEPEAVCRPALANLQVLEAAQLPTAVLDRPRLARLQCWTQAEAQRLAPLFRQRKAAGRVREGHGDLHLGNLALLNGRIEVFDCLEFSPELRWIDVISDLAFLAMDLEQRRLQEPAQQLLGHWLEASGDYDGRALVRAKVTALRLAQAALPATEAEDLRRSLGAYLHWADSRTRRRAGALVITHGVSGSGKSHWARRLAQRPGWLQLRSDVERKRRFGLWGEPQDDLPPPDAALLYSPQVSNWLYRERLLACSEAALAAGFSVVVDATFLRRADRQLYRALAGRLDVRFAVLACACDEPQARLRLESRRRQGQDPSDADDDVLTRQLAEIEPIDAEERQTMGPVVEASEEGLNELAD